MGAINYNDRGFINIGYKSKSREYEDVDYDIIKSEVDELNTEYYKITLEGGYYEGFYININHECYFLYDNEEREEMAEEWERIKQFIHNTIITMPTMRIFTSYGWCGGAWLNTKKRCLSYINKIDESERERIAEYPLESDIPDKIQYINNTILI